MTIKNSFKAVFVFFLIYFGKCHAFSFTVMHTNDLHSHFQGVLKYDLGVKKRVGHYANLAGKIRDLKMESKEQGDDFHLLFDGGDFFSGSLFHIIGPQASVPLFPEYEFFNYLDYDAVTLGNHEFDAGPSGFETMLRKIELLGNKVPVISTNFSLNTTRVIQKSLLIEKKLKNGDFFKIGVVGALSPDGCRVSQGTRESLKFQGFDDQNKNENWGELAEVLDKEIKKLRGLGADFLIVLYHGGGKEDLELLKHIEPIDLLISGHTHEVYFKKLGKTFIAQAGSQGAYVGAIPFEWEKGKLQIKPGVKKFTYEVNEDSTPDGHVKNRIDHYKTAIRPILKKFELPSFDEPVTVAKQTLIKTLKHHDELGRFVTNTISQGVIKEGLATDVHFTSLALIRNSWFSGHHYKVNDIFKILPIGFSNDLKPGSPLIQFYLKKEDLKKLIQFLELYSRVNAKFTPAWSENLSYEIRKWGVPFFYRIKNLLLKGKSYDDWPNVIPVSTNRFVFRYIDFVKKKSFGLIDLIPRNKEGKPLTNITELEPEWTYFLKGIISHTGS